MTPTKNDEQKKGEYMSSLCSACPLMCSILHGAIYSQDQKCLPSMYPVSTPQDDAEKINFKPLSTNLIKPQKRSACQKLNFISQNQNVLLQIFVTPAISIMNIQGSHSAQL